MKITHICCVFFNLMTNCVTARNLTMPETILTHLVVVALLTFVPEPHEIFPLTGITGQLVDY